MMIKKQHKIGQSKSSQQRKNAPSGFTLIEMAVVITILSLSAAGGLAVASKSIRGQKRELTLEKMSFIMNAIEEYVAYYGYLPCPTAIDQGLGEEDSGFGVNSGDNDCTAIQNNASTGFRTGNGIIKGFVPVYTLHIPPEYFYDAWDRRFTYVVDEDLTSKTGFNGGTGNITIYNVNDDELTGAEGATVLLISHGERAHGAYRLKGSNPTQIDDGLSGDNFEEDNGDADDPAGFDDIFYDVIFRNIDGGTDKTDEPFDDFLLYRTKWQLAPEPALP